MTLLARVAWFVLGLGMVIGAMLLTAHFAHADDKKYGGLNVDNGMVHFQSAPFGHDGEHFTKDGKYVPPNASPWMTQRDICIRYGAQIYRGGEKQNDWLLFCMQQAHWAMCEFCMLPQQDHAIACGQMGTDALYDQRCWYYTGRKDVFGR